MRRRPVVLESSEEPGGITRSRTARGEHGVKLAASPLLTPMPPDRPLSGTQQSQTDLMGDQLLEGQAVKGRMTALDQILGVGIQRWTVQIGQRLD
jgi:hypothetical protein